MESPLALHSFLKAIVHIDGDAFFASCEQLTNNSFRNKPIVTGLERGIATSMSYEAKAKGVTRGMPIHEIRRVCPEAIILPSDYETYSLMSLRMYEIVRRYTETVEEYSIDECFADITGLRRSMKMSYTEIATSIKKDLDAQLGITFSVGLAPTKVLAKVASKWKKPSGLTVIQGNNAHLFLRAIPLGKIWGIGPQTSTYLAHWGIYTALDFAQRNISWVESHLTKPHQIIWHELRATAFNQVNPNKKTEYKSISKTRTFTPPSSDPEVVLSQLSKNIENVCSKARTYHQASKHIVFFLKTQDFRFHSIECTLSTPVNVPEPIIRALQPVFNSLFKSNLLYRSTGVFLKELQPVGVQKDIFGEHFDVEKLEDIHVSMDALEKKFGKHTIYLCSSHRALESGVNQNKQGHLPKRQTELLKGETNRRRLSIPVIGSI